MMRNRNFKNIEEQVDRMKSLFTEERLYGNLIKESLIVEMSIIPGKGMLGTLIRTIIKKGGSKIPLSNSRYIENLVYNETTGKITGDIYRIVDNNLSGKGKLLKSGTEIPFTEFLDPTLVKQISERINALSKLDSVGNYLSKGAHVEGKASFLKDLGDIYKSFIKTFNVEGVSVNDVDTIISFIQEKGLHRKLGEILSNPEILKGVGTEDGLRKKLISGLKNAEGLEDWSNDQLASFVDEFLEELSSISGFKNRINELIEKEVKNTNFRFGSSSKKIIPGQQVVMRNALPVLFKNLKGFKNILESDELSLQMIRAIESISPGLSKRFVNNVEKLFQRWIRQNVSLIVKSFYRRHLDLVALEKDGLTKWKELSEPTHKFLKAKYGDDIMNKVDSSDQLLVMLKSERDKMEKAPAWKEKVKGVINDMYTSGYGKKRWFKSLKTTYDSKLGVFSTYFRTSLLPIALTIWAMNPESFGRGILYFLQALNWEDTDESIKQAMAKQSMLADEKCIASSVRKYKYHNPEWDHKKLDDKGYIRWQQKNAMNIDACVDAYEVSYDILHNQLSSGQLYSLILNSGGFSSYFTSLLGGDSSVSQESVMKDIFNISKEETTKKALEEE